MQAKPSDLKLPPRLKPGDMGIMSSECEPDLVVKILGYSPYDLSASGGIPRYSVYIPGTGCECAPWQLSVFPADTTEMEMELLYSRRRLGLCGVCLRIVWVPIFPDYVTFDILSEVKHLSCWQSCNETPLQEGSR